MASIKIAAILRAAAYSPNHIGNDAAILNLTCEQLRKRGCEVRVYSEEQLLGGQVTEEAVIQMCRGERSMAVLQGMESRGIKVYNSAYGVENCIRERMARILPGSGIPYPETIIVNTNESVAGRLGAMGITRAWIKKGEMYAMHKEDVTFVRHAEEAQEMLQEYFLRGIRRAVINRHLEGVKIKYYGVMGADWFRVSFPFLDPGESPAGFDLETFRHTCERAAEALDIMIYGGDALLHPDGTFTIIDFNDWPTFAPFRAEASGVIARTVLSHIKGKA